MPNRRFFVVPRAGWLVLVAAIALCNGSRAQRSEAYGAMYDGTWRAWGAGNDQLDAELELRGGAGTWRLFANKGRTSRTEPCIDRSVPVEVQTSSPERLVLLVRGSVA